MSENSIPDKIKQDLKKIIVEIKTIVYATIDNKVINNDLKIYQKLLYSRSLELLFEFLIVRNNIIDPSVFNPLKASINLFNELLSDHEKYNVSKNTDNSIVSIICGSQTRGGACMDLNTTLLSSITSRRNLLCNIHSKLNKKYNECDTMNNKCKKIGGNNEIEKLKNKL